MIELSKKYKSGTAIEILQQAILSGEISGSVTQDELAQALGISRMPVREALIALEYQGLIERFPNQHVKISSLNDESIHEIFNDMAQLEIDTLKILRWDTLKVLKNSQGQVDFHRAINKNVNSMLRRKLLEIFTEVYLSFVLNNSDNVTKIDAVFSNLSHSITWPLDINVMRACYSVYGEVLANELIKIRRRNRENVES